MIAVKHLNKSYERRRTAENQVLKDVSFTLPDRGFVCILGPSGCGKTSLLNAVGGLDRFDSGSLSIGDLTVSRYGVRAFEIERNRDFGYIFQNYYLLDNHSVAYNIYLGLHNLKLTHAEKIRRVREALRAVDMERYIRRTVGELSGGQQQRVAIARALARRPRVIFADEPTGNLDQDNTRNICGLLRAASRDSLVIMVTHEEDIARFYADRIISLSDGRIVSDQDGWAREGLSLDSDKRIYTEGLEDEAFLHDGVTVRLLREPGAAPAELTIAVLKDRVVLKLTDPRAVSLGGEKDPPAIIEGAAPQVTLEELDRSRGGAHMTLFDGASAPTARPGSGIGAGMLFGEARQLRRDRGKRGAGMWVFLVLLTVLSLLAVGDMIALSRVDPEDFLVTESHVLQVNFSQGSELNQDQTVNEESRTFLQEIAEEGPEFVFVPGVTARITYTAALYRQMDDVTLTLPSSMSYVPSAYLDEGTLLYGRMPERSNEVVMDRQLLEAVLESDSVAVNGITDLAYFVDKELVVEKRNYTLRIVGVCDGGSRALYASRAALLALCNSGINLMPLSELQAIDPAKYGGVTLGMDQCIVNASAAGVVYKSRIGDTYHAGGSYFTIVDAIDLEGNPACVIVADELIEPLTFDRLRQSVQLYCPDKAAMLAFLREKVAQEASGSMRVEIVDPYQDQYDQFARAAHLRADARTIVTGTLLVLCLVMLLLLCRTQARERVGLLAVYRLLGIPRRKLYWIFLMDGALSALTSVLPAALITFGVLEAVRRWTSVELPFVLGPAAVALTGLGILIYFLLVSVLPLVGLLRMPPAQLAAQYDL